jgi:RNA polymerase sigma factor (sigma-70 family)
MLTMKQQRCRQPPRRPNAATTGRTDQQFVQDAPEQLPRPSREVILLCDIEEMSCREIAETLGIPIGTVMSWLSRARKSMRELYLMRECTVLLNEFRMGWKTRPLR